MKRKINCIYAIDRERCSLQQKTFLFIKYHPVCDLLWDEDCDLHILKPRPEGAPGAQKPINEGV